MSAKFSIIIPNLNGLEHLRPCLESLLPQLTPAWEIVVVDNASNDGSRAFVETLRNDRVGCLALSRNFGFAEANNLAAQRTSGQWLFLLNNDTRAEVGLLSALQAATDTYTQFEIFACKMLRMSDGRVDNCGIHFSQLLRGYQLGTGLEDTPMTPIEVFGASGGAMLVKRDVLIDIGLFEPTFFAYQEDVDFAVRARLAGYRCLFIPDARVHHRGGGTSNSEFSLYHIQRNMELVVLRNCRWHFCWYYVPGHLVYSVFQVVRCAIRGRCVLAVRAKLDALRLRTQELHAERVPRISKAEFGRMLRGFTTSVAALANSASVATADMGGSGMRSTQ